MNRRLISVRHSSTLYSLSFSLFAHFRITFPSINDPTLFTVPLGLISSLPPRRKASELSAAMPLSVSNKIVIYASPSIASCLRYRHETIHFLDQDASLVFAEVQCVPMTRKILLPFQIPFVH